MVMLDNMIRARRFAEFVREVMKIRNNEMVEQARWEFWLHKVIDMSFEDYLAAVDGKSNEVLPAEVMEATVKDSMGILNGFCPE